MQLKIAVGVSRSGVFAALSCKKRGGAVIGTLFHFVFLLCILLGLPLHIAGRIRTAALQWLNMVNHIAGARTAGFSS